MASRRFVIPVTTIGDGTATAYSPFLSGRIATIRYILTDYAAGVDFTITAEATGENIWTQVDVNASVTVAPRQATHSTAGVASLYAATFAVNDLIRLSRDRVKIVIAQGGATKTGTFHIVVED